MNDDDVTQEAVKQVFADLTRGAWERRVRDAAKAEAAQQLAENENYDWRTMKPLLMEAVPSGKWLSGIEIEKKPTAAKEGRKVQTFWLKQHFNSRETAIEGAKLWMRLMRSTRLLPPVEYLPILVLSEDEYKTWCKAGQTNDAVKKVAAVLTAAGTWMFDGTQDPLPSVTTPGSVSTSRFDGIPFGAKWIDDSRGGWEVTWRGEWSPAYTYQKRDLVKMWTPQGERTFTSKHNGNLCHLPTGEDGSEWWETR